MVTDSQSIPNYRETATSRTAKSRNSILSILFVNFSYKNEKIFILYVKEICKISTASARPSLLLSRNDIM